MNGLFGGVYEGRRVLVTGDTGFKGSWLSAWLLELGAEVAGYSLDVPTDPSNFAVTGLESRLHHYQGDVRDRARLAEVLDDFRPEIVFHMAAQALVRRSYADPAATFETNTLGTLNVLECLRVRPWAEVAVVITSDKCYRNVEWTWGYREHDALGGHDPYSGSKGCAELVFFSYYHSFFRHAGAARIATARAGNVIGGGDWAEDRIMPDCVRSWSRGETVVLRSPHATRPWQHVLEPLSGYLALGAGLWRRAAAVVGESYNFGPPPTVDQSVLELVQAFSENWPAARWMVDPASAAGRPEATLLKLCCDKALADLDWQAVLHFEETVRFTSEWYRNFYEGQGDMFELTRAQIAEYVKHAKERGVAWSLPVESEAVLTV